MQTISKKSTSKSWVFPVVVIVLIAGGLYFSNLLPLSGKSAHSNSSGTDRDEEKTSAINSGSSQSTDDAAANEQEDSQLIEFPQTSWQAVSLKMEPAQEAMFSESRELTGKIALNEDHVAHIHPLVEGRVDEVKIRFGERVKQGDTLVIVQSKEVGQTMMQLYQDRLQLEFVTTRDQWTQEVTKNTQELIGLIRTETSVEEIEQKLAKRLLGNYRDQLMTAYINYLRAHKNHSRLSPLSQDGVVTGRQLLEAESEWNLTRASLQSMLEQIQQNAQQEAITSRHTVKEWQTRVAFHETSLKILGFDQETIDASNPQGQGEAIAHYPIIAPFDGTIISKDVVLLERVGPENQILSIADLSTVWVTIDLYEEHLPLLELVENKTVLLRSNSLPGQTFEAVVFYTGDLVQETTRTVSMRAIAQNPDGKLKPGMFVNVEFPGLNQSSVVQVPPAAVQEHEGKTFVFLHLQGDQFERRDIRPGRKNASSVEVLSGLKPGEAVVVNGGFALKSQMLAELLSE